MHVSEQSKSLPPIQPPPHCSKNCSSVASLHRHRDSLEFSDTGLSGGFAVAFIKNCRLGLLRKHSENFLPIAPRTAAVLPLCTATEILWNSRIRGSPVALQLRLLKIADWDCYANIAKNLSHATINTPVIVKINTSAKVYNF